jgi:hypothetical protein
MTFSKKNPPLQQQNSERRYQQASVAGAIPHVFPQRALHNLYSFEVAERKHGLLRLMFLLYFDNHWHPTTDSPTHQTMSYHSGLWRILTYTARCGLITK